MKIFIALYFGVLVIGCTNLRPKRSVPGAPLFYYNFDDNLKNDGLLELALWGEDECKFTKGYKGSALEFVTNRTSFTPLIISFSDQYNVNDYEGFTLMSWLNVKTPVTDSCIVFSDCHYINRLSYEGWRLMILPSNIMCWEMSDGKTRWRYEWQNSVYLNQWIQWGFSYSKMKREISIFRNGVPIAFIGIDRLDEFFSSGSIEVGGSMNTYNLSNRSFNGAIDEFSYWARPLKPEEVANICQSKGFKTERYKGEKVKDFKVLSVGVEAIDAMPQFWQGTANVIEKSGAEVILLQNSANFGAYLARTLNFYGYNRGDGFWILTSFPLGNTYQAVNYKLAAAIRIFPDDALPIWLVTCMLSDVPKLDELFNPIGLDTVAFKKLEATKRGNELRLLLGGLPFVNEQLPDLFCMGIDLNSGSHLDWTPANSATFNGTVFNFQLTNYLQSIGLVDAYRLIYPNEKSFSGFNAKRNNSSAYNSRELFLFFKGRQLVLEQCFDLDVLPQELLGSHKAVVSSFQLID